MTVYICSKNIKKNFTGIDNEPLLRNIRTLIICPFHAMKRDVLSDPKDREKLKTDNLKTDNRCRYNRIDGKEA